MEVKKRAGRPYKGGLPYKPKGLKEEYIGTLDGDETKQKTLRRIFSSLAKYESQLNKQFFEFTELEIATYFRKLESYKSYTSYKSALTSFITWGNLNNKFHSNLDLVSIEDRHEIERYVYFNYFWGQIILNREYVYNIIERIQPIPRDCVALILAYEGLTKTEIEEVKISDCDFDKNTIKLDSKIINIPNKSMDILKRITLSNKSEVLFQINDKGRTRLGKRNGSVAQVSFNNISNKLAKYEDDDMIEKVLCPGTVIVAGILDGLKSKEDSLQRELTSDEINTILYHHGKLKSGKNGIIENHNTIRDYINMYKYYKVYLNVRGLNENRTNYFLQFEDQILFEESQEDYKNLEESNKDDLLEEYKNYERDDKDIVPPRKDDGFESKFAAKNTAKGASGEEFLCDMLNREYGDKRVYKIDDRYGYDLYDSSNTVRRIEVKTANSLKSDFFMTINEIKKASQYKNSYYLYILIWKDGETYPVEMIQVQDPINFLNIDMDKTGIVKSRENDSYVSISYKSNTCFYSLQGLVLNIGSYLGSSAAIGFERIKITKDMVV